MSAEPAYQAVVDRLFELKPVGRSFGIDRMRRLCGEIGRPERSLPCVHVAGTNGKGSVSASRPRAALVLAICMRE
jgi:dihydrofolate synthase/folylpolyglutamate synthase